MTLNFLGKQHNKEVWSVLVSLTDKFLNVLPTIPNISISFLIFIGTVSLRQKSNTIVNRIASTSFEVYLFHQTPVLIDFLWTDVFQSHKFVDMDNSYKYVVFVGVVVYVVASLVDILRRSVFEKIYMNSNVAEKISKKLDGLYEGL